MLKDAQGLDVTTDRPETVAAIDRFNAAFLGYTRDAVAILDAADSDFDCALAQALAAALNMFMESPEAAANARPYLARARAQAARATRREQQVVAAIGAWVDGDIATALKAHEELARTAPQDLAMVKVGQYHHFNLGDCAGLLRLAEHARPANENMPYFHGLAAFGFEQCHLIEAAEAAARRALEVQADDPWAHHALAHVMETQGRVDEGVRFMTSVADTWAALNSFMVTHNWWHVALFHLDRDEHGRVLDLYDNHIWGVWKEYSQDQAGAAALLARLELRDVNVGNRWTDVADHIEARGIDLTQPFLALHYVLALARAGRPAAQAYIDAMEVEATICPPIRRAAWREVALPVARGLLAYATGDARTAVTHLQPAMSRLLLIGGSHAQRDLFHQIEVDALVRAGDLAMAQQLLEMRRQSRPNIPETHRRLAGVYAGLGLERMASHYRRFQPVRLAAE